MATSHKRRMRSAVLFAALSIFATPAMGGAILPISSGNVQYGQAAAQTGKWQPAISNRIASDARGAVSSRVPPARSTALWDSEAHNKTLILSQMAFSAEPPKRRYEVTAPIRTNLGTGLPNISGPPDNSLPLVVIDPGHGGHDPGAVSLYGVQQE